MDADERFFVCFLFLMLLAQECLTECTFPEFLRSAKDEETGLLRPWKTGTHWFQISTNPQIQELSEIYVTGSDMWQFKLEFPRSCETKARRLSNKISRSERCGQRTLSYNRTCLTVDNAGLHTYRLLEHHREGWSGTKYVCVSFQRRGNNVSPSGKGLFEIEMFPNCAMTSKWKTTHGRGLPRGNRLPISALFLAGFPSELSVALP